MKFKILHPKNGFVLCLDKRIKTLPLPHFMDVKHVIAQTKKISIQAIMVTKCNLYQFI